MLNIDEQKSLEQEGFKLLRLVLIDSLSPGRIIELPLHAEIKEVRKTAAVSPTLEEKLAYQKCQRELEAKRSKLRRDLFARQDEVEPQRNGLISELEVQLQQQVEENTLFTIEWELK